MEKVVECDEAHGDGHIFISGDFNTEPVSTRDAVIERIANGDEMDPAYKALMQRPFILDERDRAILEESSQHISFVDEEEDEDLEAGDAAQNQPNNVMEQQGVPPGKHFSREWQNTIENLASKMQWCSLYGAYYSKIDAANAGDHGEPKCTNYANVYRGTLDYIICPASSISQEDIVVNGLLKLPDISRLRNGQPQEGQFPSDHFCLMASVTITKVKA